MDPQTIYLLIKTHAFQIIAIILAIVGFALRLRGFRKQSTVVILFLYFVIYIFPAIWRRL